MRQRNTTKTNGADDRLTPQQATAVDLLVAGHTLTATAEAIGVDRATVSGWVNHRADFQAALNSRRQEIWEGIVDGLRHLLPRALQVLQQELEGPNALQAAVHAFKMVGLYGGMAAPTGPTTVEDAEQVQRRQALAREQAQLTEDDVRIARERRSYDRLLAELASGPLGVPPV